MPKHAHSTVASIQLNVFKIYPALLISYVPKPVPDTTSANTASFHARDNPAVIETTLYCLILFSQVIYIIYC